MRFYLLMKQAGEGCDYTIGCGYKWKVLEARGTPEAIQDAVDFILGDEGPGWEGQSRESVLERAILIPADEAVELAAILKVRVAKLNSDASLKEAQEAEARDRAKYEELRRRFGG